MGGTHLHGLTALPVSIPKHVYFGMIRGIACQSCLTQVLRKRCGDSWLDSRDKGRLVGKKGGRTWWAMPWSDRLPLLSKGASGSFPWRATATARTSACCGLRLGCRDSCPEPPLGPRRSRLGWAGWAKRPEM